MAVLESRRDWYTLVGAVLACEVIGGLPGFLTATRIDTWYTTLVRPGIAPPNWVFAPVWTLLFALLGVAVFLIYRTERGRRRRNALAAFVGQFALNVAWTLVFFGTRSIAGGLVVIVSLVIAILLTVWAFDRIDRRAALLLVPYLAWVGFATLLNYRFWVLN